VEKSWCAKENRTSDALSCTTHGLLKIGGLEQKRRKRGGTNKRQLPKEGYRVSEEKKQKGEGSKIISRKKVKV